MSPKFDEIFIALNCFCVCFRHSLENFAKVTQVERVVRLCGRWPESPLYLIVNVDGARYDVVFQTDDTIWEWHFSLSSVHPLHDVSEDCRKRNVRVRLYIDQVKVANVSIADNISRWLHSSDKRHFDGSSEVLLRRVDVIPTTVVHPLSQQLDWRLCTILLFLWHIQIVDENHAVLAKRRTVEALSLLLHTRVDDLLSLICSRLGGESQS